MTVVTGIERPETVGPDERRDDGDVRFGEGAPEGPRLPRVVGRDQLLAKRDFASSRRSGGCGGTIALDGAQFRQQIGGAVRAGEEQQRIADERR